MPTFTGKRRGRAAEFMGRAGALASLIAHGDMAELKALLHNRSRTWLQQSAQLACFELDNAHCYDPNEEAKLRLIIGAVSKDVFTQRVCLLAEAALSKDRQSSSSSLST